MQATISPGSAALRSFDLVKAKFLTPRVPDCRQRRLPYWEIVKRALATGMGMREQYANEQALTPVPIAELVEPIARRRCKRIPGFS